MSKDSTRPSCPLYTDILNAYISFCSWQSSFWMRLPFLYAAHHSLFSISSSTRWNFSFNNKYMKKIFKKKFIFFFLMIIIISKLLYVHFKVLEFFKFIFYEICRCGDKFLELSEKTEFLSRKYFLSISWEWSFFQFSHRSQYYIYIVHVYITSGTSKVFSYEGKEISKGP